MLDNHNSTKMSRSITRTIKYDFSQTNHDDVPDVHQTVKFVQEAMWGVDAHQHRVKAQFGNSKWVVDGTLSPYGLWDSVDIPQIKNYRAYVNGQPAQRIDAKKVDIDTMDSTVVVTYKLQNVNSQTTYHQDLVYQDQDGKVIKKVANAISGTLVYGSATVAQADINVVVNNNLPAHYQYVSGKPLADEAINRAVAPALTIVVKKADLAKQAAMNPQGPVLITFVEKGNPDHVLGTTTARGTMGDTVDMGDLIHSQAPKDWHVDPAFTDTLVPVPGSITVPLVEGAADTEPDYVKNLGLVPQGRSSEGRQGPVDPVKPAQKPETSDDPVSPQDQVLPPKDKKAPRRQGLGFASLKLMLGINDK